MAVRSDNVTYKPDGIHPWDGQFWEDIEEHRNVTVVVSRNMKTGELTYGWIRQDNTEDEIYSEEDKRVRDE